MTIPATLAEIDTPALVLDLDALAANIAVLNGLATEGGRAWRPQVQEHRSTEIARLQIAAGAIGITASAPADAELFAAAGVRDILLSPGCVGRTKLERVADLCCVADPIVSCDHYAQAEALSQVCAAHRVHCRVLIELHVGGQRTGVRAGSDALDLGRAVARLEGLKFAGLMCDAAHLEALSHRGEQQRRLASAIGLLQDTRDQFHAVGLNCAVLSVAGAANVPCSNDRAGPTERQTSGVFASPGDTAHTPASGQQPALSVLATVVSRPKLERAILDCGRRALAPDLHPPAVVARVEGRPLPDARIAQWLLEHAVLDLGPVSQELHIGDKLLLRPGCSALTTQLHDRYYGVRKEAVEAIWPIAPRGF